MTTPMKSHRPNHADLALRSDIMALIKRHLSIDTADRVLAMASQIVGQCLALQDQRAMTVDQAWDVIVANIEIGNRSVIDALNQTKGNA